MDKHRDFSNGCLASGPLADESLTSSQLTFWQLWIAGIHGLT